MQTKTDPSVSNPPYQLNQNSGTAFGQSVIQQNGINVTGGSTVGVSNYAPGVSTFTPPPGTPTSKVYLGQSYQGSTLTGNYQSYEEAKMAPLGWSEKQMKQFVNQGILYKMPKFSSDMGLPEIMDAWDDLVQQSQSFSRPGAEMSPNDIMQTYNHKPGQFGTVKSSDGDWLLDARTGEKIKYIGPRSKTTTEKRVDLSSPEDVRAITTQMLTQLLGRAPTSEELAKYRGAITGMEKSNPTVATTTTQINAQGEAEGSSTTTSGGVSDAARQQIVEEGAKVGPEYGKYQSATTYFNAMMQMIGG